MIQTLFTNPLEEGTVKKKVPPPCIMVIFGATGDLTARKLMPALYNIAREGQLPAHFACVAFARRDKTQEQFRSEVRASIDCFSRSKPIDEELWNSFSQSIHYHQSTFDDDSGYKSLKKCLRNLDIACGTKGNRIFYLSTQPSHFPIIIEKLSQHNLSYHLHQEKERWSRIIIEKPFGRDLTSANTLHKHISKYLHEDQIYRIDHYLGKETVQNILAFRFANSLFESLWNNRHIDHVQITVGEEIGIGTRGNFFEEAGLMRDIVQNHMMQLLSLVAMEPPVSLRADAIRDEKVKVLESIRPIPTSELPHACVHGQYSQGYIDGENVVGYREEDNVNENSNVETYIALKLFVDNWRWAGVPFYLRGGKRLPKRGTEISIIFKQIPNVLFNLAHQHIEPNVLVIRIQPNEGSALKINCKIPGLSHITQPVKMNFQYGSYFGSSPPEAYERLICDCMLGDSTLFTRGDEVLASWKLISPILEHWKENPPNNFPNYRAGMWGPAESDAMLARDNRSWRLM